MVTAKRVVSFLETPNPRGLSSKQLLLENEDLKPVERQRRLWTAKSFVVFWVSDGFNLNTWYIASAMLPALNWWQAWLCVWIGYTVTGFMVAFGARAGAVYHVGFPVATRASFGIWGSLWPVFNRAVMACVWTDLQAFNHGSADSV